MKFAPKLVSCALFVIAIVGAGASRAADYPTHPVRIIIGFGAGASADTPARLLAQKFTDALGQQFIVENKPGAGSNVAAEYVAAHRTTATRFSWRRRRRPTMPA